METILSIRNLKKVYQKKTVLDVPELDIFSGESFGLVGNNGAGKTTLFRLILDLIKTTEGEVLSNGKTVAQSEHWKSYTGAYLDEHFLIPFLSPIEYFNFTAKLYGWEKGQLAALLDRFADFFDLQTFGKKYIRDLSTGNKSKVGILGALIGDPELLILDEPFANIDPGSQIKLRQMLRDIQAERQMTVLVSSHDLRHMAEICNRIVLLHNGQVARDTPTTANTLHELEAWFTA